MSTVQRFVVPEIAEDLQDASDDEKEEIVDEFLYEVGQVERRAEIERVLKSFKLNPLEVLKIASSATSTEIKAEYKKISMLIHPDKVEESSRDMAQKAFTILNDAQKDLLDETKRSALQSVINQARSKVKSDKEEALSNDIKARNKLIREQKEKVTQQLLRSVSIDNEAPVAELPVLSERDVCADADFEEQVMATMKEILIEREWRQRQLEKEAARIENASMQSKREQFEKSQLKQSEEKDWEDGREKRVNSWRNFTKAAAVSDLSAFDADDITGKKKKKRKLGMLKTPKLTQEDPNATYIKRVIRKDL